MKCSQFTGHLWSVLQPLGFCCNTGRVPTQVVKIWFLKAWKMPVSRQDIRLSSAQTYLCIVFLFSRLTDRCRYNQQFSRPFFLCFYKYLKPNSSFPAGTECMMGYRIKKYQDFEYTREKQGEKFLLDVNPSNPTELPISPCLCREAGGAVPLHREQQLRSPAPTFQ